MPDLWCINQTGDIVLTQRGRTTVMRPVLAHVCTHSGICFAGPWLIVVMTQVSAWWLPSMNIHTYVQVHVTRLFTYLRILAASGAPPSLQVLKRVGQEAEAHGIKYWTGALASMSAGTYQVSGAK